MYTRYPNYRFGSKVRVPENYSGNAFFGDGNDVSDANVGEQKADDVLADAVEVNAKESAEELGESVAVVGRAEKKTKLPQFKFDVGKLFSGGFGYEELLIVALILHKP